MAQLKPPNSFYRSFLSRVIPLGQILPPSTLSIISAVRGPLQSYSLNKHDDGDNKAWVVLKKLHHSANA